MSVVTFTFPTSAANGLTNITGNAPLTLVLQPSAMNYGGAGNFISTITYLVSSAIISPEKYTRTYTYCTIQEALTGANQFIDSRSNFAYTFYNSISGQTINTILVSAVLFPSLRTVTYTIKAFANNPWLTKNPVTSGTNYVFESIHLLKNRAWGQNNEQIILVEGISSPGQLFFLNSSDTASAVNIKPDAPNPPEPTFTPTPTPTPTPSPTPTATGTPIPTSSPTPTPTTTPTTTPTPTGTPTISPTPTPTTPPPTATPTPTATTAPPTATPTPTPTATTAPPTSPPTATPTPTPTATTAPPTSPPTDTPTPTPTATTAPPTSPPTDTPTPTPTATPSPTPTATVNDQWDVYAKYNLVGGGTFSFTINSTPQSQLNDRSVTEDFENIGTVTSDGAPTGACVSPGPQIGKVVSIKFTNDGGATFTSTYTAPGCS